MWTCGIDFQKPRLGEYTAPLSLCLHQYPPEALHSLTPMGDKTISIKQKSDENKEKYHLGDYLIQ